MTMTRIITIHCTYFFPFSEHDSGAVFNHEKVNYKVQFWDQTSANGSSKLACFSAATLYVHSVLIQYVFCMNNLVIFHIQETLNLLYVMCDCYSYQLFDYKFTPDKRSIENVNTDVSK